MTRRELRRGIEELRDALGLRGCRTIDEWERLPAALRDALAARALIAEWGDEGKALVRLGFPAMNKLPANQVPIYRDHIARVFDSPGVRAILKRDLARVDADQEAIISRLHRSAIYGDDATSVRAAALLIKVCGWECQGDGSLVHSGQAR